MTTTRGGGEIGLRSCAEATVIEDLLEVITPVSGLVKRNLDLIRQLGATATAELEAVEKEEAKVEKDVFSFSPLPINLSLAARKAAT